MLSPHLDMCALRMAQVHCEKDHHFSTSGSGNQRRDHVMEERCVSQSGSRREFVWAAPRLYWGVLRVSVCVSLVSICSLHVNTDDSAAGRNNPVQPTTRVTPVRSGDFELHGKTDKRANTCVSELSHGDRTSGAVVDHNDPVESSLVICAPGPLQAPTRETVPRRMHLQHRLLQFQKSSCFDLQ